MTTNNRFILNLTKVPGLSSSQQVVLYAAGLTSTLRINTELQQPPDQEITIALAQRFHQATTQTNIPVESPIEHPDIRVSLHAVTGITTSQTMQVQLTINCLDFLTLLDSGSTRNFIDSETVEALHLNRLEAPNNFTIVANGSRISNVGILNNLTV